MSFWTHIYGSVLVAPVGRTQHEKTYILNTVLDHLPRVTGSEGDMDIYVIPTESLDHIQFRDEFGFKTENLKDRFGQNSFDGSMKTSSCYSITVRGNLRDRMFEETFREFMKWLCRLSKRVSVEKVLVSIDGYCENEPGLKHHVIDGSEEYLDMWEIPSWSRANKTGEPAWWEYLMWDRAKDSEMPILLKYKYFKDEENDREAERRINYY